MSFVILLAAIASAQADDPAVADDYQQQEMPLRPQPAWVRMIDQRETSTELAGIRTPAGIRVDVVAREPALVDPVGMAFDDQGTPYVLEWREASKQVDTTYEVRYQDGTTAVVNRKTKDAYDQLKRLVDADNDGVYESAELVMDDLEYPSSVLLHEGWMYFPSVGHVIRRRPAGERREEGGPWETEEILRGMCGYHHHQVSGLTVSHDNWLYTTTGDDDNRAEGSDGSRATVLRTGAIFRSRPDGSELVEFARGFRNPYRNVVFDEMFNMFHVDNDQEDGSKFQGVRLMHLLEGADYGWRLAMGAKCCRTDFERGAVWGERPGKMPSMLKVGRGAPAGLLIYQQPQFPEFFRGLLIYPDCYRRLVRAFEVERHGSSFRVVSQFVLMESDDDRFRPVQAIAGPDGAIYILDWHTDSGGAGKSWGDNQHGRLYRLSWTGIDGYPAIPLGSRLAWADLPQKSDDELFQALTDADFELRCRVQRELVRRGPRLRPRWLQMIADPALASVARAQAIGAASQMFNGEVQTALVTVMRKEPNAEIRRLLAEALQRHASLELSAAQDDLLSFLETVARDDDHPAVRRAASLALVDIALRTPDAVPDAAGRLHAVLLDTPRDDVWLWDGILRALERCGQPAISRLVADASHADPARRELAIQAFAALRTRAAAWGLDQLLTATADPQTAPELTAPQLLTLIETYRHIQVEPPLSVHALNEWLERNPTASGELRVAALTTLGMIGGDSAEVVEKAALTLLEDPQRDVRLSAIAAIGNLRLIGATRKLVDAFDDEQRSLLERQAILTSLSMLRAEGWPFLDRADPGVELVLDDLIGMLGRADLDGLHGDILSLVGQIDLGRAIPAAERMLQSDQPAAIATAIDVLGTDAQWARRIAESFRNGELPATVQSNVAAALQRHVTRDPSGELAEMLHALFRSGLQLTLEPAAVGRIESLVRETGNPDRGRQLFLDEQRSQCAKCHRLEGVGGEVGPDLTRIWQTHSVAKILESIVQPSREIKEGFATWSAETKSGQVYVGLKLNDAPREVVLRDANGRDIRIPRDQLEQLVETRQSVMPEGTVSQLTFTELIDLLAFLKSDQAQRSLRHVEQ